MKVAEGDLVDWIDEKNRPRRAYVDKIMADGSIRLLLCASYKPVWASSDELKPLDTISRLATLDSGKTLQEQIAEIERGDVPDEIIERVQPPSPPDPKQRQMRGHTPPPNGPWRGPR
jgi:hypothetical protein